MLVAAVILAGCGSEPDASVSPHASASPRPSPSLGPSPEPIPTPHLGVITVLEVVHLPSAEEGKRVFAMLLRGEAGTSAIRRSLEIRAWMEPTDGSSCPTPPVPTILRPAHADAVQPALADQTRTVAVRSQGRPETVAGARSSAKFRYGPVPSLNGDFEGWVSFHFPSDAVDGGFCAFDLRAVVVVVAGETTTAELPAVRIDTRDHLDGRSCCARPSDGTNGGIGE